MVSILDLDANHYKENSNTQYANVYNLLRTIDFHPDSSILDVGCGHGEIVAELSQLAPYGRSVGVDPSPNMISLAAEMFLESKYKNLEFHQAKAEEMNFRSNSFDLIICTNALQWVREPKKALNLMTKFLKPEGYLIIFTYSKNTPFVRLFEGVLKKYFPELKAHSAVNTMLTVEEHKKILNNNHVSLKLFQTEQVIFRYKNEEEFKNYIKGWLSCYAPIPYEQQEDFLEKIMKGSASFNISYDPLEIAIPHKSLSIKACKVEA